MKDNIYHRSKEEIQAEMALVNAAKGNPDLFAPLYDKYYKPVFLFIFRRTEDEALTADLTQHVFIAAMINIRRFQFKGVPFSAWLYRIAFNEINMYFRKAKRERTVSIGQSDLKHLCEEAGESESEANNALLMKALGRLRDDELQLVELRFFEQRPFAEIGQITGLTENNAKVKLYRILEKLKNMLKGKIHE
ncbi:MAG: sigma-70 family RNA polymerase sigma factor [Bacteroidota bacterium]